MTASRAVTWDGCFNARDLGGLPATDGAVTRFGRLFRSADTRFITAAGWAAAGQAGVKLVIDLRNPDEVTPGGPPAATTVTETITDLLAGLDLPGYLAAARMPPADISALRTRLR